MYPLIRDTIVVNCHDKLMMALVGSLEVLKYKDDGDDDNLVYMDCMFICVVDMSVDSSIMYNTFKRWVYKL